MRYAFEYNHSIFGYNHEVGDFDLWVDLWNADRNGELTITHIDATTDNWDTMFEVFDLQHCS